MERSSESLGFVKKILIVTRSLKNRTVREVIWSFVDNIVSSGITFWVGLILARLLTPEEYGIMAMIVIFVTISSLNSVRWSLVGIMGSLLFVIANRHGENIGTVYNGYYI